MNTTLLLKLIMLLTFNNVPNAGNIPAMPDCDTIRSNNETVCTACNLYHEARGDKIGGEKGAGITSMIGVANVTYSRVDSEKFKGTFCGVVWQRRQFSWTHDGKSDRVWESEAWDVAYTIAFLTVNGHKEGRRYFPDNTNGSLWYHKDNINPDWTSKSTPVAHIGVHNYYDSITLAIDLD